MDLLRAKIVAKLFSTCDDEKMAELLEEEIFNYCSNFCDENNIIIKETNPGFLDIYLNKSRSIFHNMKSDSYINNTDLVKLLKKNTIKYKNIIYPNKIFPSRIALYTKDLALMTKELEDVTETATTTQFTCYKCRKNTKCCYFSMQTRSSDEPMTNFSTCLECNHNWRE